MAATVTQGYAPDYDIRVDFARGEIAENKLATLLGEGATIEVKTDFRCQDTGNIYFEYKCKGKPSGLATTKADWFVIAVGTVMTVLSTAELRNYLRHQWLQCRDTGRTATASIRTTNKDPQRPTEGICIKLAALVADMSRKDKPWNS